MAGAWDEQLHAMDYLAYAYLQGAQDRKAKGVLDELNAIRRVEPENFKVAYAFTAIPARYALERRRWDEAAALTLRPSDFPWDRFRWAEANIIYARAMGAARSGDTTSARHEVEKLAAIRQSLPDHVRFLAHGHRIGFGVVAREELTSDDLERTAALAAADIEVFTRTTSFAIMQSLRLDYGPSGPVHP